MQRRLGHCAAPRCARDGKIPTAHPPRGASIDPVTAMSGRFRACEATSTFGLANRLGPIRAIRACATAKSASPDEICANFFLRVESGLPNIDLARCECGRERCQELRKQPYTSMCSLEKRPFRRHFYNLANVARTMRLMSTRARTIGRERGEMHRVDGARANAPYTFR